MAEEIGTLDIGEAHPSAHQAFAWVKDYLMRDVGQALLLQETFASTALSGSRLAEVCGETLRRIMHGEPVSDRYLLGLAWTLRNMAENKPISNVQSTEKTK